MRPGGRAFHKGRVGMSPRGAWEMQKRGEGEAFLLKKKRGIVIADLPAGTAIARLSGKGDRSPLWPPLGVRHSFAHPPLGREGWAWGQ